MTDPIYRILKQSNRYAVQIGEPDHQDSVQRTVSGFNSEREAREWIKADYRHVAGRRLHGLGLALHSEGTENVSVSSQ